MSNAMFDVNTFNHFQTSNSDKQSTGQSSLILRQKLLKKGGPNSTGSSGSSRSYRKNNNGFKFHNFVVNQEKKACLEEQHGTKKISVSHWKKQNDDDEQVVEVNNDESKNASPIAATPTTPATPVTPVTPPSQQQSILESLLVFSDQPKKINKRKSTQIRRVLRPKINDEAIDQDEPLDLSFKKAKIEQNYGDGKQEENEAKNSLNLKVNVETKIKCDKNCSESPESIEHLIKSVNLSAAQASAIMASVRSSAGMPNINNEFSMSNSHFQPKLTQSTSSSLSSKHQKQRQTQRSLIKKQLEDAFKQNGFLVKVKC